MSRKLSAALSSLGLHTNPQNTDMLTTIVNGVAKQLSMLFLRQAAAEEGRINVKLGANSTDPQAKGDGVANDTDAILAAIEHVESFGGVVYLPPGRYRMSLDILPSTTWRMLGCGQDRSTVFFDTPGKSLRLGLDALGLNSTRNPVHWVGELFSVETSPLHFLQLQANHHYNVGDRARTVLTTLAQGQLTDVDLGLHLLCVEAGTTPNDVSSPGVITTNRPGATFALGGATFQIEDWSGISVSTPFVRLSNVNINNSEDMGLYVHGAIVDSESVGIGDGCVFDHLRITGGDGHGIYTSGDDANQNTFVNCQVTDFNRGNGIFDTGFLANHWHTCRVISCRRSFYASTHPWSSTFIGCYEENCTDAAIIQSPNFWLCGAGGPSSDVRSTGPFDNKISPMLNGQSFGIGDLERSIGLPGKTEELQLTITSPTGHRVPDVGSLDQFMRTDDTDDPAGYLRFHYALAPQTAVSYDHLMPRSSHSPGMIRFSHGFYLGNNALGQVAGRMLALDHAPTSDDILSTSTRLWRPEDYIRNTKAGAGEPWGWRPNRRGGRGGGIFYGGGTTWATGQTLRIDEGIEPSTPTSPTAFVFRLKWIEVRTSTGPDVWVRDLAFATATLPSSEPDWSGATNPGDVVFVPLPTGALIGSDVHRLVFENFAPVGVDYDVGPLRSGTLAVSG